MNKEWISDCTGEIYSSFWHMIKTIIMDMIHYPKCRTIEMFNVRRYGR